MSTAKNYPKVEARPEFAVLEEKVLAYWQENGIFKKSLDKGDRRKSLFSTMDRRLPPDCPTTVTF